MLFLERLPNLICSGLLIDMKAPTGFMLSQILMCRGSLMNAVIKKAMASMALLAASVSVGHAAGAGSGTITFEGEILEAACSIKPGNSDQTVPLGEVAKSQLETGGASTPKVFEIELTGCSPSSLTDKTVSTTFTGAESVDVPGALGITGTASGAGVMMIDGSGTAVTLGTPTKTQLIQAGDNTLSFSAFLRGKGTGTITPGAFAAVTNFSLTYK